MLQGYLNLVLHAHLPYVRHPERDHLLEERWLFEAITESYIPLLKVFQRLNQDGVYYRVTISLSPPLISMLSDELVQSRYRKYLENLISLAESEVRRTAGDPHFHPLAEAYLQQFCETQKFFDTYHGNILTAFRELMQAGTVELITSAATHAFLPYIHTDEALRAQIAMAMDLFQEHFGVRPAGMWLPEAAYTPRLDHYLREFGICYFFVDAHAFASANPQPVFGTFAPVSTSGIAVFARDSESSEQVWSSEVGYPGDVDYREYYRDIGFDLPDEYIRTYIHPDGIRVNTGIKYYRVTGKGADKAPYDIQRAREKAALHADHFLSNRQRQLECAKSVMGRTPVVTAPYDAELFGHWWYEGPIFIDMLLRKIHFDQDVLKTITPSEYLALYQDFQSCQLGMSTWGRNGYGEVWLNGTNDWIYPALHDCEQQMVWLANTCENPSPLVRRTLNQAARELMLAESSDWAFIMDARTMVDYAVRRTKHHVNRFRALVDMVRNRTIDVDFLSQVERMDNLFPNIDYRIYRSLCHRALTSSDECHDDRATRLRVLMLSWEFPPMTVGGLARHVYDLSRHLVRQGCEVHVVATATGEAPVDEIVDGVHVHRVHVLQPDGGEFVHFVLQLNLMMLDRCRTLMDEEGYAFDVLHAHDWLVCEAAKALKRLYHLPLIATIHATEHGRNQGIHTDVQRHIHQREWELTYEARRVIVCSSYMKQEVETVFNLPAEKIDVLPNGIDRCQWQSPTLSEVPVKSPYADETEPLILFVGRLVPEKGVHVLLAAAPAILEDFPQAKFVIVGKGPMQDQLVAMAQQLGIAERVAFTGFVADEERNRLLRAADLAVFPSLYEPFGIVVLEAMAAGTPVVASDVGGLGDIVQHEHNGLSVYPGDAQSLATQVRRILRDRDFARNLSRVAEAELVRFDWSHIAEETVRRYQAVVESCRSESVRLGESV